MTGNDHDKNFLRRWSRRKIEGGPTDDALAEPDLAGESTATAPDDPTVCNFYGYMLALLGWMVRR